MQINDIYKALKKLSLCKSAYDFSKNYLKKNRSYLSVLNARGSKPSIEVWTMLNYKLHMQITALSKSHNSTVQLTVKKLTTLKQEVTENIMQECAARSL